MNDMMRVCMYAEKDYFQEIVMSGPSVSQLRQGLRPVPPLMRRVVLAHYSISLRSNSHTIPTTVSPSSETHKGVVSLSVIGSNRLAPIAVTRPTAEEVYRTQAVHRRDVDGIDVPECIPLESEAPEVTSVVGLSNKPTGVLLSMAAGWKKVLKDAPQLPAFPEKTIHKTKKKTNEASSGMLRPRGLAAINGSHFTVGSPLRL